MPCRRLQLIAVQQMAPGRLDACGFAAFVEGAGYLRHRERFDTARWVLLDPPRQLICVDDLEVIAADVS
jgi:hypothetical protein